MNQRARNDSAARVVESPLTRWRTEPGGPRVRSSLMAPRSNWKGYLKLSLVSCPVQLFPATTTKDRVAFHLLNRETGRRRRPRLVGPETEETVESDEQVKGYEVAKNEYVVMEEGEIDAVAIE